MAGLRLELDPSRIVSGGAQAESALEQVKTEAMQTEAALNKLGTSGGAAVSKAAAPIQNASRGMGNFGTIAQQVGFQVQDFAVQVGAGTSAVQAFSQQGSQLLGILGPWGAIAGAALAVILPLTAAIWNMSDGAKEQKDIMDDLADASDAWRSAADRAKSSMQDLRGEFGDSAAQGRELYIALRDLALLEFAGNLDDAAKSLGDSLGGIQDRLDAIRSTEPLMDGPLRADAVYMLREQMQGLNDDFGIGLVEAQRIGEALDGLARANSPAEVAAAARELLDAIRATADETGRIPEALRPAAVVAAETAAEALRLSNAIGEAETEAQKLSGVDMATSISAAGAAASFMADELARAVANAQSLAVAGMSSLRESELRLQYKSDPVGLAGALAAERYDAKVGPIPQVSLGDGSAVGASIIRESRQAAIDAATQTEKNRQELLAWQKEQTAANRKGGKGKGGSGKSAVQEAADDYNRLRGSLDPVVRAEQEYAKAQETVNAALKAGYISQEQANETLALAKKRLDEAQGSATGFAETLTEIGGSALDRLISGTGDLRDIWKDVLKQIVLAAAQQKLMGSVKGASKGDSVGTLIFKGLFGGFFDDGGTLPMGQFGIVGENGPELVKSTSSGAVITSRVDTASMMRGGGVVEVQGGDLTLTDDGRIMTQIRIVGRQAAQAGASAAVGQVRSNWGGWSNEYAQRGALA